MNRFVLLLILLTSTPRIVRAEDKPAAGIDLCASKVTSTPREDLALKIAETLWDQLRIQVGGPRVHVELTRLSPPLSRPGDGIMVWVKEAEDLFNVFEVVSRVANGQKIAVEVDQDPALGDSRPVRSTESVREPRLQ